MLGGNNLIKILILNTFCSWTSFANGTSCQEMISKAGGNLTTTSLQALNPGLDCSQGLVTAPALQTSSICLSGNIKNASSDYNNIANPNRDKLLQGIAAAFSKVDPDLTLALK